MPTHDTKHSDRERGEDEIEQHDERVIIQIRSIEAVKIEYVSVGRGSDFPHDGPAEDLIEEESQSPDDVLVEESRMPGNGQSVSKSARSAQEYSHITHTNVAPSAVNEKKLGEVSELSNGVIG